MIVGAGLALLAFGVRRHGLGPSSLWHDDTWVALAASRTGWGEVVRFGLVSPGFVVLLKPFFALGGDAPIAAQMLPLAAGVAGPVLLYLALVDRRLRRPIAVAGAVLLASSPAHAGFSIFVKQYTVEAALTIAIAWCAWTVIDEPSRLRWLRLLLTACAGLIVSASVAPVIVVAVVVAGWSAWRTMREASSRRWIVVAAAIAGGLGLAWVLAVVVPVVNERLRLYWEGAYIATDAGAGAAVESAYIRLRLVMGGLFAVEPRVALAGVGVAAAIALWRQPRIGLLGFGPVVIAGLLAVAKLAPIGTGRTDIYLYPLLLILVAVAVDAIVKWLPRVLRAVVLAVVVAAVLVAPFRVRLQAYPQQDMRSLVAELEARQQPGDAIVLYPWGAFAFALYTREPVELVPSEDFATGWAVSIRDPDVTVLPNRRDNPSEYEPFIAEAVAGRENVWLVSSQIHEDLQAIWAVLTDHGFARAELYERPGALLELWVRAPGAAGLPSG